MVTELIQPTTAEVVSKFIENYGFNGLIIVCLFAMGWKLLGLMKAETSQQDKMLDQNANTLILYKDAQDTNKALNATLAQWFKVTHDDSVKSETTLTALTTEVSGLKTAMETPPTLADLMQELQGYRKEVRGYREEVQRAMDTFNETIKKATQEIPVVVIDTPVPMPSEPIPASPFSPHKEVEAPAIQRPKNKIETKADIPPEGKQP